MRFRSIGWTALAGAAMVLAACQSFQDELEQASQLRQVGQPDRARQIALNIIEQRPRTTAAWLSLVQSDLALAEKVRREDEPDSLCLYLWEAARVVISHWTDSKRSRAHWKAATNSVYNALAKEMERGSQQMKDDIQLATADAVQTRNGAPQLLRRMLLYRELLRRLPTMPEGLSTYESELDNLMRNYTAALELDPRARQDLVEQLRILLDRDFKRLHVARRQLGGVPLEIFLDMPSEAYLK